MHAFMNIENTDVSIFVNDLPIILIHCSIIKNHLSIFIIHYKYSRRVFMDIEKKRITEDDRDFREFTVCLLKLIYEY